MIICHNVSVFKILCKISAISVTDMSSIILYNIKNKRCLMEILEHETGICSEMQFLLIEEVSIST